MAARAPPLGPGSIVPRGRAGASFSTTLRVSASSFVSHSSRAQRTRSRSSGHRRRHRIEAELRELESIVRVRPEEVLKAIIEQRKALGAAVAIHVGIDV